MEQKRLCPFCMGELPPAATVCPHCGKISKLKHIT